MTEDSDSMLNTKNHSIASEEIAAIIDLHKSIPAFAQRPLTTGLVELVAQCSGMNLGVSFALTNFLLLLVSGLLLFRLSLLHVKERKWALFSMVLYFFCFSNLYLFFPPIYGYDEPLQFSFIFAGLIAFYRRNWLVYIVFFSLAMVARESSSILIPGLAFVVWKERKQVKVSKQIAVQWLLLILPVIFHTIFVLLFLKWSGIQKEAIANFWDRSKGFRINTDNAQLAMESLTSLFLVVGIPAYFLLSHIKRVQISKEKMNFIHGFLITLVINSFVVLTVTQAREARLFAIPLFFVWPILGELVIDEFGMLLKWNNYKVVFGKWINGVVFLFLLGINYIFSFFCYQTTVSGDSDHYFNEYLFISLILISVHVLMVHEKTKSTVSMK